MLSRNKGWFAVLFVLLACWGRAEIKVGDAFPGLGEQALSGGEIPNTVGKVVVVDFWASWCAPCRASFPALSKVQTEFSDRVVIVGVSVDEKEAAFAAFVKKMKPAFVTVRDGGQRLVKVVEVPTMPTSYVIDRTGRVRFRHEGFRGSETEQALRREIAQLLAEGGRS